jgi:hypothetical protein
MKPKPFNLETFYAAYFDEDEPDQLLDAVETLFTVNPFADYSYLNPNPDIDYLLPNKPISGVVCMKKRTQNGHHRWTIYQYALTNDETEYAGNKLIVTDSGEEPQFNCISGRDVEPETIVIEVANDDSQESNLNNTDDEPETMSLMDVFKMTNFKATNWGSNKSIDEALESMLAPTDTDNDEVVETGLDQIEIDDQHMISQYLYNKSVIDMFLSPPKLKFNSGPTF